MIALLVQYAIWFGISYAVLGLIERTRMRDCTPDEARKRRIVKSAIIAAVLLVISLLLVIKYGG